MVPWAGPGGVGGGKLTVIKAGPGFHEEKSYDIGADGHFSEVKPVSMMHDGRKCCSHGQICRYSLKMILFAQH